MKSTATDSSRYPASILCPTDFSPLSRRALAYATGLAMRTHAKITALNVCVVPLPPVDKRDLPEWMPDGPCAEDELIDQLRRFVEPARAAGAKVELSIHAGDHPGDEILRVARSLKPDMIVMGSHGRRGRQRLLGSHAEHVLRRAPCPVLTVSVPADERQGDSPVQIGRIVCAASGSPHSLVTIACAARLATDIGAKLTVVHVRGPLTRPRNLPEFAGLAGRVDEVEERAAAARPAAEILHSADDHRADLIVVGRREGAHPVLRILGTPAEVTRAARCGVLTVGTMSREGTGTSRAVDEQSAGRSRRLAAPTLP
jgi:nucleotide-binding universal stress UspA family protein